MSVPVQGPAHRCYARETCLARAPRRRRDNVTRASLARPVDVGAEPARVLGVAQRGEAEGVLDGAQQRVVVVAGVVPGAGRDERRQQHGAGATAAQAVDAGQRRRSGRGPRRSRRRRRSGSSVSASSKVTTSRPSCWYAGEARIFGIQVLSHSSAVTRPPGRPSTHGLSWPSLQRFGVM